ncbi:unnamed protein product [Moneuplotes crassus]|uniref:Uncharacterized protein n=2 Tax=Euplotes crassus TaxID=5936 RepID=A0AAD1XC27_EUPCR|nr:unnamed protein product [Moneuplotes crassus]
MMNRQFEDQFMMDRQISSKRAKASPGGISSKYQPCDSKRSHRPSYTTLEHEREKIGTMLQEIILFFQKYPRKQLESWGEEPQVWIHYKKWTNLEDFLLKIEQRFSEFSDKTFSYVRSQQTKASQELRNLWEKFDEQLKQNQREIKSLKIKNLKFEEDSHKMVQDLKVLFNENMREFGKDHQDFNKVLSNMEQKVKEINKKLAKVDDPAEIDPEFDSLVANVLSIAKQKKNQKKKRIKKKIGKNERRHGEISESSLNKSHSLGGWKDDLDDQPPPNKEEIKIIEPFRASGGPVQDLSSQKSAEWIDELDDISDQIEINTVEIQDFFPEKYQMIENCEDSLDKVAIKQIIKMELKRELKMECNKELNQDGSGDNVSQVIHSPEKSVGNDECMILDPCDQDMIKVHDHDSEERKELSITTPRNEFLNSKENHLGAVGEKTVLQHTFEDDNNSQISVDSHLFNRDPDSKIGGSNATSSENYTHSNYVNSNEKSISHRERYTEGSRMNSERSHDDKDEAFVEITGQGENKIQFKKINVHSRPLQEKASQESAKLKSQKEGNKNYQVNAEIKDGVLPVSRSLLPPKHSRNRNSDNPYCRPSHNDPTDVNGGKNIGRDLEVIKENHSEFSNSNSVIETFRNKRKSNISSSGNNSGDQLNIRNPQEMINEEDEEDIENDTTSFRGSSNLTPYRENIDDDQNKKKQDDSASIFKSNFETEPNDEYNFFQSKDQGALGKNCEKELSPGDNCIFNRPVNLHAIEMNNKFTRSSSMSPNTRLLRSYSSEIPSYILQLKDRMDNDEDSIQYGQDSNFRLVNNSKISQKRNPDNSYYSNKYDWKITNEGSQLMKSPSMCSITIDNHEEKKKTAEFEGEDLNPTEPIEKEVTNPGFGFNKSNDLNSQNLTKEDSRQSFAKRGGYRYFENLQSSFVFQKLNLGSKYITSSIMSDSNGTFHNPFNLLPYLSSKHAIPPQTLIYYPGNSLEGEGYTKENSSINWNEQFIDERIRDSLYLNPRTFMKLKDEINGKYNHTFISGIYNCEFASFVRNEITINERNNFIHTPYAGVLFCSSQDSQKSHMSSACLTRLNPTSKIGRLQNLQSSKGSEATTAKAATKYFISQK